MKRTCRTKNDRSGICLCCCRYRRQMGTESMGAALERGSQEERRRALGSLTGPRQGFLLVFLQVTIHLRRPLKTGRRTLCFEALQRHQHRLHLVLTSLLTALHPANREAFCLFLGLQSFCTAVRIQPLITVQKFILKQVGCLNLPTSQHISNPLLVTERQA